MPPFILIIFLFFNNAACTKLTQTDKIQASEEQAEVPKEPTILEDLPGAQDNLDLLGYEVDNFDGKLTPKTQAALKLFQKELKLPITGKLDDATYQVLEREVERKKRESQKPHETVVSPPPPHKQSVQPKQKETPEAEKPKAVKPQNKPKHTKKTMKKKTPPANVFSNIEKMGVYWVAASLAEIGYFKSPLKQAKLKMVEAALKSFQKDIGVTPRGVLDEVTLKKLQNIKLSSARQAELEAVSSPPAKKKTKPKHIDPAMPNFTLKTGESVFVIEKIECKSDNEAFVLFYEGQLQNTQVQVTKRYAMWYDIRQDGVSKTDWWCIPKKRFCYSSIDFTDWGGKLKSGELAYFDKKLTMPSRFDITALVAHATKQKCSF